jgi:hypothetical protein
MARQFVVEIVLDGNAGSGNLHALSAQVSDGRVQLYRSSKELMFNSEVTVNAVPRRGVWMPYQVRTVGALFREAGTSVNKLQAAFDGDGNFKRWVLSLIQLEGDAGSFAEGIKLDTRLELYAAETNWRSSSSSSSSSYSYSSGSGASTMSLSNPNGIGIP